MDSANSMPQMTPEWSGQLAIAVHSPIFTESLQGIRQRDAFIAQATRYASLSDMPARLREVYRRAMAAIK